MDNNTNNNKILSLPIPKTSKKIEPKPKKKKRLITESNAWNTFLSDPVDFQLENQKKYLLSLYPASPDTLRSPSLEEIDKEMVIPPEKIHFLREQLRQKIYGYKSQDINKNIFDLEQFITLEYILQKLYDCDLACFYCREPVYLWYEISRESKQWSVERIDNDIGHNIGNVEIACLSCNLKRRCMYHERFVFTKNLSIVKQNSG